jgi:hypothetical protein
MDPIELPAGNKRGTLDVGIAHRSLRRRRVAEALPDLKPRNINLRFQWQSQLGWSGNTAERRTHAVVVALPYPADLGTFPGARTMGQRDGMGGNTNLKRQRGFCDEAPGPARMGFGVRIRSASARRTVIGRDSASAPCWRFGLVSTARQEPLRLAAIRTPLARASG